jgi:hypothetical protein
MVSAAFVTHSWISISLGFACKTPLKSLVNLRELNSVSNTLLTGTDYHGTSYLLAEYHVLTTFDTD